MINWTPEGLIGRLFATMRPYAPAPPPDAFRDFFKMHYGPTTAVYDELADRPDARAALDQDFEQFLAETDARIVGTSSAQ